MQSITFNQDGGPISVALSAGQAQPGSYELRLWEAGTNQIVMQKQGNFLNDADDAYPLPTPNAVNNGRLVQGIMTIALLPPITNYSASITIEQDGKTLGEIPISGTSNEPSVILNLYATLVADAKNAEGTVADGSTTTGETTSVESTEGTTTTRGTTSGESSEGNVTEGSTTTEETTSGGTA